MDDQKESKVKHLLKLMEIEKTLARTMSFLTEHLFVDLDSKNDTEIKTVFQEVLREQMPEIRKVITDLYSASYTEEEISGLILFYSTSLGKKVINLKASMDEQMVLAMTPIGEKISFQVRERLQNLVLNEEKGS